MRYFTSFTVATAALMALPTAAYLPSVPKSVSQNTNDLDISSILAETEAALKIADEQLKDNKHGKVPPMAKKAKPTAPPVTTNGVDISDLMAEVELALNEAGASEEWSEISQLLAETETTNKKPEADKHGLVYSLGSIVWDTTSTMMTTLGKSAFSYTKEQLRPDSTLSKLSRKAAEEAEERAKLLASNIDLVKMEKEGKECLAKIQEMININTQEPISMTSSWKDSIAKYVADAMTSPFIRIWENRDSQTLQKLVKEAVTKENLVQHFTNRKRHPLPSSTQPPLPTVKKQKSYFFMQEKETSTTPHPSKPAFVAGFSMPAFVMADNFLRTWMRYTTSTCVLLVLILRHMAGVDAVDTTNNSLLDTAHILRAIKAMSSSPRSDEEQVAKEEPKEDGTAAIPYFARAAKKSA